MEFGRVPGTKLDGDLKLKVEAKGDVAKNLHMEANLDANAALSIIFYNTGDCTGYSASNFTSDRTSEETLPDSSPRNSEVETE